MASLEAASGSRVLDLSSGDRSAILQRQLSVMEGVGLVDQQPLNSLLLRGNIAPELLYQLAASQSFGGMLPTGQQAQRLDQSEDLSGRVHGSSQHRGSRWHADDVKHWSAQQISSSPGTRHNSKVVAPASAPQDLSKLPKLSAPVNHRLKYLARLQSLQKLKDGSAYEEPKEHPPWRLFTRYLTTAEMHCLYPDNCTAKNHPVNLQFMVNGQLDPMVYEAQIIKYDASGPFWVSARCGRGLAGIPWKAFTGMLTYWTTMPNGNLLMVAKDNNNETQIGSKGSSRRSAQHTDSQHGWHSMDARADVNRASATQKAAAKHEVEEELDARDLLGANLLTLLQAAGVKHEEPKPIVVKEEERQSKGKDSAGSDRQESASPGSSHSRAQKQESALAAAEHGAVRVLADGRKEGSPALRGSASPEPHELGPEEQAGEDGVNDGIEGGSDMTGEAEEDDAGEVEEEPIFDDQEEPIIDGDEVHEVVLDEDEDEDPLLPHRVIGQNFYVGRRFMESRFGMDFKCPFLVQVQMQVNDQIQHRSLTVEWVAGKSSYYARGLPLSSMRGKVLLSLNWLDKSKNVMKLHLRDVNRVRLANAGLMKNKLKTKVKTFHTVPPLGLKPPGLGPASIGLLGKRPVMPGMPGSPLEAMGLISSAGARMPLVGSFANKSAFLDSDGNLSTTSHSEVGKPNSVLGHLMAMHAAKSCTPSGVDGDMNGKMNGSSGSLGAEDQVRNNSRGHQLSITRSEEEDDGDADWHPGMAGDESRCRQAKRTSNRNRSMSPSDQPGSKRSRHDDDVSPRHLSQQNLQQQDLQNKMAMQQLLQGQNGGLQMSQLLGAQGNGALAAAMVQQQQQQSGMLQNLQMSQLLQQLQHQQQVQQPQYVLCNVNGQQVLGVVQTPAQQMGLSVGANMGGPGLAHMQGTGPGPTNSGLSALGNLLAKGEAALAQQQGPRGDAKPPVVLVGGGQTVLQQLQQGPGQASNTMAYVVTQGNQRVLVLGDGRAVELGGAEGVNSGLGMDLPHAAGNGGVMGVAGGGGNGGPVLVQLGNGAVLQVNGGAGMAGVPQGAGLMNAMGQGQGGMPAGWGMGGNLEQQGMNMRVPNGLLAGDVGMQRDNQLQTSKLLLGLAAAAASSGGARPMGEERNLMKLGRCGQCRTCLNPQLKKACIRNKELRKAATAGALQSSLSSLLAVQHAGLLGDHM